MTNLNGALRQGNIWHISEVEAVIIEPTGNFVIYKRVNMPENMEPEVLLAVPGYQKLVEHFDHQQDKDKDKDKEGSDAVKGHDEHAEQEGTANDIAAEEA